ncbi:hypothetical protein Pcinc_032698 [Petrolisthes cinctipes]|uniref:Uncharacterized protein n=1 Tax=Petrolisthes cinctipes TaxID=88211 RepID=A0AAE1EU31_PETCI|nr:hypothetical protein Pcinc_032698 [Petrolisthes cinctipes]
MRNVASSGMQQAGQEIDIMTRNWRAMTRLVPGLACEVTSSCPVGGLGEDDACPGWEVVYIGGCGCERISVTRSVAKVMSQHM